MRLIDAETFPNKLKEMMIQIDKNRGEPKEDWFLNGFDEFVIALDVINLVKEMPTIDAEPVRHGHWIRNDNGTYSCSECHSWIPNEQHYYARYCLFCGAKMNEEKENETD